MDCVTGSERNVRRKRPDHRRSPAKQRVRDGNEVPKISLDVPAKQVHQLTSLRNGKISLSHMPMEYAGDLDERPAGGADIFCRSDEFSDRWSVPLVDVVLGDVRRIKIHGQRSSSRKLPLSPGTEGNRRQISVRSGSFVSVLFFEMGRSSATGSPRRSIRITVPSAASRTSSEVRICKSRIDAFFMCYIVALRPLDFKGSLLGAGRGPMPG